MASVLASRASTLRECRSPSSGRRARRRGASRRRAPSNRSAAPRRARRAATAAIEPDRGERVANAERLAGLHGRRLHPIDADRLLVAHLVLEADVDVVAASRASAWSPARSAPRRGRSAESRRSPGRKLSSADHHQDHRPRAHASALRSRKSPARPRAETLCRPSMSVVAAISWLPAKFRADHREFAASGKGRPPRTPRRIGAHYCSRTMTLSVAPLASITVRRTKPGPSGSKNSVRRPARRPAASR